ncbi:Serine/Threonine protein kinase and Signal Transduction Histidine Kinase (STHK) with GAF and PAS/PAC sensor [Trichormus variabilis ATCC 29413]|uniref:histidine kinase n=2 Tax=Anabaena variabilis TaxID=264691 RepID=Q3M978_TRIV2|nr:MULTISPECIES: ATP-binding sensor histidine kinase [Nostocaceae]ABA22458.1 Serine/Threonine protein kinase and Signal Transduction Histidine Kinase (STHK) with GAF and PAS/PAC sensor [Trichormus variabilis ATCC 29413]MBC1216802.1 AAA family ATPase [Trichormus variabilis ARAD]MBC1254385.1 AAA family ATPase [Trichormus variabilis V5]MBC1269586.1 AAA family ATPase [Trichormus variabilis FSR]MBC1304421.1 AAA family ATPase [Trichormus variabilis N2B]
MIATQVSIPGYIVHEQLYDGSRTFVYRSVKETDNKPVVIKLLKNHYPSFSELVQFRNQYTIAKNLNYPGIIRTYSLESFQNGYILVMEDFGGISLKDYFFKNYVSSLDEFLQIAIALCNTLDILYKERIIHKDIKPSNILINPETKQVKLIDFSIASLLPRETQTLVNPNVLEGTLAYISPEQTGRMNRGIDYRTDFYSLGVTFYELLTRELPFPANEPMEVVHCHIAKTAPLAHEVNPQIPPILSAIVSKLMAKNVEDRYQSALGLKYDLENCLSQLQATGKIESFKIAQRDVCDRFIIPDKLYGREAQIEMLLQAFDRVSLGATEMMLVAGFSGIGKTAVVNEVHKPIVRQRGYFIKGKFEQFQRNIPFSAFVQAFRNLIGKLLTESNSQIQQWKVQILEALGENGQVIIDVIPELELIIGQQPPTKDLSGSAAQNRFNLLFQKFTHVFTSKEHPLVIFLDDLQWADLASLNLMQILIADTEYLLLIGAYRDNEVSPSHPLMFTLGEIKKLPSIINTITLTPLSQIRINQLVADTLKCTEALAWNLSQLVYQKTQGNPFFSTQFLKALHQENLIQFNFFEGYWQCDITAINQQSLTSDVVEFMVFQLQRLSASTQDVLKLAACIGNYFDLSILAIVSGQTEVEIATDLWQALQEGLILPTSNIYKFYQQDTLLDHQRITNDNGKRVFTYKFLHDRVQQAAYSLIPNNQKAVTHLKIGELLRQNLSQIEQEEKLFDIVGHLNRGQELITQLSEREALAKLNLQAGVKARNSTAYAAATEYLQLGIELLQTNCWQTQYELALNLHIAAVEVAYLNGDFEEMEKIAAMVLRSAQTILDKVKIYTIQIAAQTTQSQMLEAIAIGTDALSQLGVEFPREPDEAEIAKVLQAITNQLQSRQIGELVDLPVMTDPTSVAAMQLLGRLFSPIFVGIPGLLPILSAKMVSLSLQFGNTPTSTVGYAIHGLVMCAVLQEVETGYSFGKLALSLLERFNLPEYKSMTLHLFGDFIQHHRETLQATKLTLKDSYRIGMDTGDFLRAGYSIVGYSQVRLFSGVELDICESELATYSAALAQVKQFSPQVYLNLTWQTVKNLREPVNQPDCLIGSAYDETQMFPKHFQDRELTAISTAYIAKLMLAYLWGNYSPAISYIKQIKLYLMAVSGLICVPIFHFYAALTYLAIFRTQSKPEQAEILAQIATHQTRLHHSAQNAPMNHLHKWYLVEAEKQRVLGYYYEAGDRYDRAIAGAKANGYIQEEGLANELAAKFYLDWGREKAAIWYLQEAYYCYAKWGAKAKVADLERRYPQLLAPILQQSRSTLSTNETIFTVGTVTKSSSSVSSSSSNVSDTLDLTAILKASQAISGEIELEKLLSSLLRIIIENAGADKCVLMLLQDNHLLIQGSITQGYKPIMLPSLPVEDSLEIPHKLIYKVKHSQHTVVLLDATADTTLANDPYIIRQKPLSILCSPILYQGKLLGILYLENNLVRGAFTSDRVQLLNLLCTQVAISLENAQLYQRSQENAQQLERSLEKLRLSEARFQKLANNVPGIIYQIRIKADGSASIPYVSSGCQTLYEIAAEDFMSGKYSLRDFEHPDDRAKAFQIVVESAKNLTPFQHEWRIITPNGNIKWVKAASQPERGEDGEIVWDGILIEISDLKQAELDLQQAQLQIIQSEKMSALGNLVAGVAHEMNNPLGFIAASLKQAKPTFADILEHLKIYQETLPDKTEEILDHESEIDLEYTIEDLPKMLDSMTIACDRLKNISTSLRTFSRADRDYKVPFNLHEGIDSTILILKHRLKSNEQRPAIEVITNYGNLPQLECFPGQLNQVFMNILVNAIDALDESNHGRNFEEIKSHPNQITITTSIADKSVKISIADNGKGMSEEVKHKIFDHLFTTKGVGKGTGLGLAIAKQIVVESHGGQLKCNSALGEGTEFIIEIPV